MVKKALLAISLCAIAAFVVYAAAVNIRTAEPEPPGDSTHLLQSADGSDRGESLKADGREEFEGAGAGMTTLRDASGEDKYTFAFFYQDEDADTKEKRQLFEATMNAVSDRAEHVLVNATDPSEKDIVKKYGVDRAPMPLVLAIAPNGAVTRGLPKGFSEKELLDSFVSPCMEKCLKAVQDSRIVAVCVQNASTRFNTEAMQGVQAFMAEPGFSRVTDLVMLDPGDPAEATTCKRFGIDPRTEQAITLLLAPPGKIIGRFKGAADKDMLIATITKATSGGCGPGSSPGCCPK